ncbi:MAG: tetratricopeptide repeat protein [Planctomycetes bacterium]|nr:tetratricopeptide repeat protein [Planctomycetota bacterium]
MMSSRPVRGWSSSKTRLQRLAILSLVGCVFAVAVSPAALAGTADDDYRNAIGLYKKGRWQLSAEALKAFLKQHPRTPKIPYARLYLGVSLENLERYQEARRVLRAFIKDYPQNANRKDALYRVGECSYFLGEWKTAESELLAFLKAAPKHEYREYALPNLAESQYHQQKFAAAVENYRKSLAQFGSGRMAADSKLGLARCYQALKKTDEAIKLYRHVAALKGSHSAPDAQMALGQFYYELGRFGDSAKTYDRFEQRFAKNPRIPRARLNAGFACYQSGDFRAALSRFEKAAGHPALRQQANYWVGFSHKALREYPQAVAVLKAEFARDGKTGVAAEILYQWATCERLASRPEQARRLYLDYVKRWPKKTNADQSLHYAAEMALAAGKSQDALALIERFNNE